jgi:hypothetical protein
MNPAGRDRDALGLALVVAAVAFAVNVLASHAGLTVARQAAFLQAALWGVVLALVVWHCWRIPLTPRRPPRERSRPASRRRSMGPWGIWCAAETEVPPMTTSAPPKGSVAAEWAGHAGACASEVRGVEGGRQRR